MEINPRESVVGMPAILRTLEPKSKVQSHQVGCRGQLSHGAEKWPFQKGVGSK